MVAAVCGFSLILMLAFPAATMDAARQGLLLWAQAVLPALLPYLVCCQLLSATGALSRLGTPLDRLSRALLCCPGEAVPVALLAFLGGSPAGARLIALRHGQGAFTRAEAERLACLTGTVSPMFLLGTLPMWMRWPGAGVRLVAAHLIGALVAGLAFARCLRSDTLPMPRIVRPTRAPGNLSVGDAVSGAAQAMLTVGGCIVLATVAARLLSCAWPGMPPGVAAGAHALLEMAGGSAALIALPLSPRALLALVSAAVSFGGLSILAQNAAFLAPLGVRASVLLSARLLHAGIAAVLAWLLAPPLPGAQAFAPLLPALPAAPSAWAYAAPVALLALMLMHKKSALIKR